ncbi:MAG: universal stress protein [Spirochaetales bacterium]
MKPLIQSIVVAISGSDASINAAKYGIILAKQYQCSMTAVYVVDTATLKQLVLTKIFVEEESKEYEQNLYANGKRYLNYIEELALQKKVKITTSLRSGAIYTEILNEAEDRKADLILLGGWEKERKDRDIISEAHREVLYNAKCSVLVVKERNIDKLFKDL